MSRVEERLRSTSARSSGRAIGRYPRMPRTGGSGHERAHRQQALQDVCSNRTWSSKLRLYAAWTVRSCSSVCSNSGIRRRTTAMNRTSDSPTSAHRRTSVEGRSGLTSEGSQVRTLPHPPRSFIAHNRLPPVNPFTQPEDLVCLDAVLDEVIVVQSVDSGRHHGEQLAVEPSVGLMC